MTSHFCFFFQAIQTLTFKVTQMMIPVIFLNAENQGVS